jgi:ABC-2 type transport system permease protein
MRNYWLVAKHEYRRMVFRRGFVIATILVPVGMAALIFVAYLVETIGQNDKPIGYVDNPGIFDESLKANLPDSDNQVDILEYPDEESAISALEVGKIQAFFVFPVTYPESLETDLHFAENPPDNELWRYFDDFVRLNMLASLPPDVQNRLLDGASITVLDVTSNREFSESAVINIIMPFVATFFFIFATMMAAGYLMGVVAGEKENKTMELVISSITPGQLIGGKAAGLLELFVVPWTYLGIMALFFLPAYALVASVMIAIGGAVAESQQGQQVAGILNLLFLVPLFLLPLLMTNPGHPAIVVMTIFPTTSFLTVSLRWGLGTIPAWQMAVSWVVLVATTFLMLWIAVRIFRAGMLRYGQAMTLKGAVSSLRGK